jgi:hypothetical protein
MALSVGHAYTEQEVVVNGAGNTTTYSWTFLVNAVTNPGTTITVPTVTGSVGTPQLQGSSVVTPVTFANITAVLAPYSLTFSGTLHSGSGISTVALPLGGVNGVQVSFTSNGVSQSAAASTFYQGAPLITEYAYQLYSVPDVKSTSQSVQIPGATYTIGTVTMYLPGTVTAGTLSMGVQSASALDTRSAGLVAMHLVNAATCPPLGCPAPASLPGAGCPSLASPLNPCTGLTYNDALPIGQGNTTGADLTAFESASFNEWTTDSTQPGASPEALREYVYPSYAECSSYQPKSTCQLWIPPANLPPVPNLYCAPVVCSQPSAEVTPYGLASGCATWFSCGGTDLTQESSNSKWTNAQTPTCQPGQNPNTAQCKVSGKQLDLELISGTYTAAALSSQQQGHCIGANNNQGQPTCEYMMAQAFWTWTSGDGSGSLSFNPYNPCQDACTNDQSTYDGQWLGAAPANAPYNSNGITPDARFSDPSGKLFRYSTDCASTSNENLAAEITQTPTGMSNSTQAPGSTGGASGIADEFGEYWYDDISGDTYEGCEFATSEGQSTQHFWWPKPGSGNDQAGFDTAYDLNAETCSWSWSVGVGTDLAVDFTVSSPNCSYQTQAAYWPDYYSY